MIAAAPRWPSCAWFTSRITGWGWSSSFSAWGVTGIIFGILLVCRWSRWYVLVFGGRVGIRCANTQTYLQEVSRCGRSSWGIDLGDGRRTCRLEQDGSHHAQPLSPHQVSLG